MSVVHAWVGATTPSSARVVAAVTGSSARLAVATNDALAGAIYSGPQIPSSDGIVQFTATGLSANTRYHWQVEDDGVLDAAWAGQFRTHPEVGSQASFTVAVIGDAGANGDADAVVTNRVSNHPAFDAVRAADPMLLLHLGDAHYRDIGTGVHTSAPFDESDYRTAYDDLLTFNGLGADARQGRLYRSVPIAYVWDNHDFGAVTSASDDSDGDLPHKAAAAQVYRERVPHYPLPDSGGIWQSFQVGRVLVVMLDVRYYRSPNSDPDDSAKAYLGAGQLAWLDNLLDSTSAEFLVLGSPQQWVTRPTESDTWAAYETERAVLLSILDNRGWLDRMCIVSASMHALGIDTGGNAPGNIPTYLFAAMDAGGSPQLDEVYDSGSTSPGRGRWGTLEIQDAGDQITVTGTGWIGAVAWRSHSFTVTVGEPAPPDPPPPVDPLPPATPATIRTRVRWYGCDLVTGKLIAPLHDITGAVSRRLGEATSASLTLPLPRAGPGAVPLTTIEQATEPGRSMVVAVVNDVPSWGGIVLVRRGGTDVPLELGCVTIEGYLDRRYVGDHDWTSSQGVDEATIVAGLLADAQTEGIGLILDIPATGRRRRRQYFGQDDATVLSRLQELMRVVGGPEWTVDLDWVDNSQTAVAKLFRLRPRIGIAASTPTAVFRTTAASVFGSRGGSEARYTYTEDYSDGRGANHVVATSSGEGEDRPQSVPARAEDLLAAGWPRWERRWSPSSSITSQDVLDEHAASELARRQAGARTWQMIVRWDAYPRLNVDWRLGDDVGWRAVGHRHPDGVVSQGRAIGWDLDIQAGTVVPIILDPASDPDEVSI